MAKPEIPESAIEHRIEFDGHWVERWITPNPFITVLYRCLEKYDVSLDNFAFKADAKNVAETALIITVNKLRTTIIVGVSKITFRINNPNWAMASQIVEAFDEVVESLKTVVMLPIKTQEATLAFHVSPGDTALSIATSRLVNVEKVGEATFYGLSLSKSESSLLMEASQKFNGGAFFRLTRKFNSEEKFADVGIALYVDEANALNLIGIEDVLQ